MERLVNLHSQLASIMEVLANAAVAEICQLVDDSFASLRLEISRSQRENVALKSRLRLMDAEARTHREPVPRLVVTRSRRDHDSEDDDPVVTKRKVKSTTLENTDSQWSQLVEVTEQPMKPEVEPPVAVIKEEMMEDPQTAANSSIGPQPLSPAAESSCPRSAGAEIPRDCVPGWFEEQEFARLESLQQEDNEGANEASALGRYSHPAEQSHRGPNRDVTSDQDEHFADPRESASAGSSRRTVPDVQTPLIKTQDSELPVVKSVFSATSEWRGEAAQVKLEAEALCPEAFRTCNALVSVSGTECMTDSSLINSLHTESKTAVLDANGLDSSSVDDFFSSPEVAKFLTGHLKPSTDGVTGTEESLSSCFPVLSGESSYGNSSMSDSITSVSNASDSRSTEQAFSCQHCSRLFFTSRDIVVHQRSHAGERIYHCHVCKKPFVHPHHLKTHQRVHTGEKPFSCAQCGKRFSQSSHIKRHMSVHTGEKRYSCGLCGKRFSQSCSLKVHQAVHTGERPYNCNKCGKSFSVLGNLVRHQSVHMDK